MTQEITTTDHIERTGNGQVIGEFSDITNDDYHSGDGISKSHLDKIDEKNGGSPRHYWDCYINPDRERKEPTSEMILGTAIHTAILEPDLLTAQYMTVPEDAPKKPTSTQLKAKSPSPDTLLAIQWWRDFENENKEKTILSADDYQTVLRCRDAVHMHPVAGPLFKRGVAEKSFFAIDEQTGELVKCRPDWLDDVGGMQIDLKSTGDASPAGFAKSIVNFNYHKQPGWYQDVIKGVRGEAPPHWVFVAIEKKRPFAVGIYYMSQADIEWGRAVGRNNLLTICHYKTVGEWPDYGHTPQEIILPAWAKK